MKTFTPISLLLICIAMSIGAQSHRKQKLESYLTNSYSSLEDPSLFIEKVKNDNTVYWGEGIANIGDDLGIAKINAKNRALADLTQKIRIRVESELKSVLSATREEIVKDAFNEKISVYTQQVITNVKERYFIDHPKKGTIAYIVYISKKEFDSQVSKDLEAKKKALRQAIRSADTSFHSGEYMSALSSWIKSAEVASGFFGTLPLQDDLDNDGNKEDVRQAIIERINMFIGGLTINFLDEEGLRYNANGAVYGEPTVLVQYGKDNEKEAIYNMPLKAGFVSGSGKCTKNLVTGQYGQAKISLSVNASYNVTVMNVTVDKTRIPGMQKFMRGRLPNATITLKKIKTVALSVYQAELMNTTFSVNVKNDISSYLTRHGFAYKEKNINKGKPGQKDFEQLQRQNVDYLLHLKISSSGGGSVGDFKNMYISQCSGTALLYSVDNESVTGSIMLPETKGYGVTSNEALKDAYTKFRKSIIENITPLKGRM